MPTARLRRLAGEVDRHGEGTDGRRRPQRAEAPGADMQDVAGEGGQERRRPAQEDGKQIERDAAEDHGIRLMKRIPENIEAKVAGWPRARACAPGA